MTITVCMCTYNGERYIDRQLDSILAQTRQPDEVVIWDDGSTDCTAERIKGFIDKNHLEERWKLHRNQENKGYPAAFYRAMELCGGSIVFLSDQDDVWHGNKIEEMERTLESHEECKVLCCKFGLIDKEEKTIHSLMAPTHALGSGQVRRVDIGGVFYKCEWPGMVLAYRNEWYRERARNREDTRIPHDFLLCAWAAEDGGFLQLDRELAYHRRHQSNAGGEEHRVARLLDKGRKLGEVKAYLDILKAFDEEEALQTEEGRQALRQKTDSMEGRYLALQSGKMVEVLKNAGKNRESTRLATLVCDLLIVRQKTGKHGF